MLKKILIKIPFFRNWITCEIRSFDVKILVIEKAGGEYRGLQRDDLEGGEDMMLFDDPSGSTRALKISEVNSEEVKKKLVRFI